MLLLVQDDRAHSYGSRTTGAASQTGSKTLNNDKSRLILETLYSMQQLLGLEELGSAVGRISDSNGSPLSCAEAVAVSDAVPARKAAFMAGRACARRALRQLGCGSTDLPAGPFGSPSWPSGIVGSVTHTREIAAAIVAKSSAMASLGLDLEEDGMVRDADTVRTICRPSELIEGLGPGHDLNLRHARFVFCAKEAVYKAYRPLFDQELDFQDALIEFDSDSSSFFAVLMDRRHDLLPDGKMISGVIKRVGGMIVAMTAVPNDQVR